MHTYTWILNKKDAFDMWEALEEVQLFEEDKEGLVWRIEYITSAEEESVLAPFMEKFPVYSKVPCIIKDWAKEYETCLPPITVGNVYIHTHLHPSSPSHISLCLEAGTAFGSGHHPTTQGCIALIQKVWATSPWKKALDLGCGSGILSLVMNALIPHSTVGTDNDPETIPVAQENALKNGIPTVFYHSDVIPVHESMDFIVANLLSIILIDMAHSIPLCVEKMIFSGIMAEQEIHVVETYASEWTIQDRYAAEGWVSLLLQRRKQ